VWKFRVFGRLASPHGLSASLKERHKVEALHKVLVV
jgi:hypothetical protein